MLKKLKAKNFRTHEDLTMEFHPGVNVIWGLPGSGKTNILRMVDWVVSNSPKFERVHSHFAKTKETSVGLEFDNGSVELVKTASTNKYSDGAGNSFSYTGGAVPEPIGRILNLSEINISKQLDPHFLITATPGESGKTINRITKIEKVDEWVSTLTTRSNKVKWGIEQTEEEIVADEKELRLYDGIEDLEKEIRLYDKLNTQYSDLHTRIQYLSNDIDQLKNLKSRIDELTDLDMDSHMQEFDALNIGYSAMNKQVENLSAKVQKYRTILLRKQKLDSIVENVDFDSLIELDVVIKETDRRYRHVDAMIRSHTHSEIISNRLQRAKGFYIEAVKEMGICPICQSKMSSI